MDIYVSDATDTTVRSVLKQDQVLAMIQAKMDAASPITFNQMVPSAEWFITHSFSYRPDVKIIDSADVQQGLGQLVAFGLLSADRVDHILHDPILPQEEYHP